MATPPEPRRRLRRLALPRRRHKKDRRETIGDLAESAAEIGGASLLSAIGDGIVRAVRAVLHALD